MPPELKPLFAIVIVLAIAHTLLKFRARAATPRARRAARPAAKAPIDASALAELAPEDALARLRQPSPRTTDHDR